MQNYFSVGVDAEVSRRFDSARSANPERFRSQTSNKIKYGACTGLSLRSTFTLTPFSQPRWARVWPSAAL